MGGTCLLLCALRVKQTITIQTTVLLHYFSAKIESLKNPIFVCLFFLVAHSLFAHDGDMLNKLIRDKIKELQLSSVKVYLEYPDSIYFHEFIKFDSRGNRIEHVYPFGNGLERRTYQIDEQNRMVRSIEYDNADTSKAINEIRFIYIDSSQYSSEYAMLGEKPFETKHHRTWEINDTMWSEEIEINVEFGSKSKSLSRFTHIGDSLRISEFISFDDDGKMHDIAAYYTLNRTLDNGNTMVREGQYIIQSGAFENISPQDYYSNPEKYLRMQLDGAFKYEYGDDILLQFIYDAEGKLIQEGYGMFDMKTFEYDVANRPSKTNYWNYNDQNELVVVSTDTYEYDIRGLPEVITNYSSTSRM